MVLVRPSDAAASRGVGSNEPASEPPLIHFGLRQFLAFVSGVALLLGAMAMIRSGWAVALGFGAAMVAAHVVATFVGTRLRDASREKQRRTAGRFGSNAAEAPPARGPLSPTELAALTATPLAKHEHAPDAHWRPSAPGRWAADRSAPR